MHVKYHKKNFKKNKLKNKNAILNKVTSAVPKLLSLVPLNDWSGPLAWQDLHRKMTPPLGTAGLAAQGQWYKKAHPKYSQTCPGKIKQIKRSLWGTTSSTGRLPTTSFSLRTILGITWEASAGAQTFFLVPFLPRSLSHTIQAMHPSRGQAQRLLGTKSQLSLPQWFIHPTHCPGKGNGTCGACRNMGWSIGTMARTCFMCCNSPNCWNDARRKIHGEAQEYRNISKGLDLNITHQDDFLT